MKSESLDLFGEPFEVAWRSNDRRIIANKNNTYYQLFSFDCQAQGDAEALAKALPAKIEMCWIVNLWSYCRNYPNEQRQWGTAPLPAEAETPQKYLLPPATKGLCIEPPEATEQAQPRLQRDADTEMPPDAPSAAYQMCYAILKEQLGGPGRDPISFVFLNGPEVPGLKAFKATFPDGEVHYFKDVTECRAPADALVYFQTAALQKSVGELLGRTERTQDDIEDVRVALQQTRAAATSTLKEALDKWFRFSPPGMKADTTARIKEAVMRYLGDPDKHSLRAIAADFRVSRKTVSTWFKRFSAATGFRVVQHERHESVKAHLRAEVEYERQHGDGGDSSNGETDE